MDVVYPRKKTYDGYEEIEDFVKLENNTSDTFCFHRAFLSCLSEDYQIFEDESKREKLVQLFLRELEDFLTSVSDKNNEYFLEKFQKAYSLSKNKNNYVLEGKEILKLTIKDKNSKLEENLFDLETMKKFLSNSKIFEIFNLPFLAEFLDQRYNIMVSENSEIKDYLTSKERNLLPSNILNLVNISDCRWRNLLFLVLSQIFKINIFLCRAWKNEITVVKDYFTNDNFPYIMIFYTNGKVSLTGVEHSTHFEGGGLKTLKGIKTILDTKKDNSVIQKLKSLSETKRDDELMEKYHSYLKKIDNDISLSSLNSNYNEEESSSDEEREELEEEKEELRKEREELEEEKEENNEEQIKQNIPEFIRNYSYSELTELIKLFIDENFNFDGISKENLEMIYYNFLNEN